MRLQDRTLRWQLEEVIDVQTANIRNKAPAQVCEKSVYYTKDEYTISLIDGWTKSLNNPAMYLYILYIVYRGK